MLAEQLYCHADRLVDNQIVHEILFIRFGRAFGGLQQVLG